MMIKNLLPLFAVACALFLCACDKTAEERINGVWKSDDAGNYFKVLLKIDTRERTGRIEKYDGEELAATHEEKIAGLKEKGDAVILEMEDGQGTKTEITLTMKGSNKMIMSGSGTNMAFTKVKK